MSAISSIAGGQSQVMQQVGMKVARKTLDVAEQQGEAAVSMLQQAAEVQKQTLAQATGKGMQVDVRA